MSTSRISKSSESTSKVRPFRIYTPASLGAAIKHYRQQAALTQAQLAAMAGMDRSYLSQLENGLETEQLRKLFSVIRALGLRVTVTREGA